MSSRAHAPRLLLAAMRTATCSCLLAISGCHFDCSLNFHPIFSDCETACEESGVCGCDEADPNGHLFGSIFGVPPEEPEDLPWPRFHPVPARPVFEPAAQLPVAPPSEAPLPPDEASLDHPLAAPVVTR